MTSSELDIVIDAARVGAAILRERFANFSTLAVAVKGPSDFVSAADFASEAAIKKSIAAAMPGARFQAEETTEARATSGERFIIDPLDGTTNFLHGIPHFAVSVAYWDDAGPRAGVVLDPMRDEIFCASRAGGAHLITPAGKRRLTGSSHRSLSDSVVHTGVPHRGRQDHAFYLRQLAGVMQHVVGIRRLGAAALDFAYVAAGRGEAFFEKDLQPWDMAAGLLLVREAGGIVTDYSGRDDMMKNSEVIAALPGVHAQLFAVLSSAHEASVA